MYTLGIDIGTTNIKSVLFAEKARPVAQAIDEYKTYFPRPSWAQQRPDDWWDATTDTIHRVLYESRIDSAEIAAVAISCQAPTMLPVDLAGKPMYDALIWMDRRSINQCNKLAETIGNNEIFRITGNRVDPFYVLGKLVWYCEKYPSISKKINKLLSPNGYINFKLTGEYSLDPVHASLTQAYDVTMHCWSKKLLDTAGGDSSIFPDITEGHLPIGQVSASAASATGLQKGTVVLAGTVDGAAAALEAGISGSGVAVEMTGTSSVLLMSSKEPTPSLNLTSMYSAVPGQYLSLGAMSSTGGSLRWFRDTLYKSQHINSYSAMDEEVCLNAKNPTGIIFLPYMEGERAPIWDSNACGTFVGLTLGTNRGQLIRSIMEGGAFALRDNFNEAKLAGNPLSQIRIVGGHANSDIWLKIKASILNRPIEVVESSLGAPGGLAYMLGCFTGEFDSMEKASVDYLLIKKAVEPVAEWVDYYTELFGLYKDIYGHIKNDYAELAKIHLEPPTDVADER